MKAVLGSAATATALVAYAVYLSGIFRGRTKPHAFSWLLWALITGSIFLAQTFEGAGAGAWVTGTSSIACFAIGIAALLFGDRYFDRVDWLLLCGCLVAFVIWQVRRDLTGSVITLTVADALAYAPTFRKGWAKPREDVITAFGLNALKYGIALLALQLWVLDTWIYPASLVVMNSAVAIMLVFRGRFIAARSNSRTLPLPMGQFCRAGWITHVRQRLF